MSAPGAARVAWHGDFIGEGSLVRVNRHLVRALHARGGLEIFPCGEPLPDVERMFGLEPRRREDLPPIERAGVTLRHRWPPHIMNPPAGWYVHVQPWELGAIPRAWVDGLRERADAVWCYSTYVRDLYVAAGLDPARVAVLPLGFDPAIYHPQVEPLPVGSPTTCIFLFVGGFAVRKNVAGAIDAFLRAFRSGDDVALLIKDNPALGAYDPRAQADWRALAERTDIPPVRFLDAQYSDGDMARLYRTAAALVHPYRGEGFGLPVLEALACGTPVIVSRGGSTDDFAGEPGAYPIPAQRVALGTNIDGLELCGEGWWLDPDLDALAAAMRDVYERRDTARVRGAAGAERVHAGWTWAQGAQRFEQLLAELCARPPQPAGRDPETLASYGDDALYELFSRLRSVQPQFIAHDAEAPAARAARRWGWTRIEAADAGAGGVDLLDRTGAPPGALPAAARVVTAGTTIAVRDELLRVAGLV